MPLAMSMLNLKHSRRLGGTAIPRQLTTLSVSWLNNQFKAVAIHRGLVEGTWEHPGEIEGPANFEAVLGEAVEKVGYRGQSVSLVLAHPRMVQQRVEVPPVKGAALKKILGRQAQQQKVFQGEAAWASQTSPSGKGDSSIILHLFPQTLLDLLIEGARNNGLHLTSVMPPSAVLHRHLMELPLESEEFALLAAETGNSVSVVVGSKEGQLLLARTIPGNWSDGTERFGVDLNRTVLFVNQQFGAVINNGIWLFGRRAAEQAPAIQSQIQLPVEPSPVEDNPFYWATEAVKLSADLAPNFISPEQQKAPQRRVFATVVAVSTILVVAVSLAATAYSWWAAHQERSTIQSLSDQMTRLQNRRQSLQQRNAELGRKQQVIKLVVADRPPPVPAWFLAYLGEALPAELVITNLVVNRTNDFWNLQIAGTFQATNELSPAAASDALSLFSSRLTQGPFHVKLLSDIAREQASTTQSRTSTVDSAIPEWVARLTSQELARQQAATQRLADHFLIEGIMR
jgi:hypothetical protein